MLRTTTKRITGGHRAGGGMRRTAQGAALAIATATMVVTPGSAGAVPKDKGVPTTTTTLPIGIPPFDFANLRATALEVTQGIQDLQNRMPLVAGRPTWIRMHVDILDKPFPNGFAPVDGAVLLKRGGEELILYPENAPITAFNPSKINRADPDAALNFLVPAAWTDAGSVQMKGMVWAFSPQTVTQKESDPLDNFTSVSRLFQKGDGLSQIAIRLDPNTGAGGQLDDAEWAVAVDRVHESLQTFIPVDDPEVIAPYQALLPGPEANTTADPELPEEPAGTWNFNTRPDEPLMRLFWLHSLWDLPASERLLGVIEPDQPRRARGWAKTQYLSSWSIPNLVTAAHETAHQRGLSHVGCIDDDNDGIPDELKGGALDPTHPNSFPNCSLAPVDPKGYYGFTTLQDNVTIYSNDPDSPAAAFPLMANPGPDWSDPYHYCRLLTIYGVPCDPASIGVPPKSPPVKVDCKPQSNGGPQIELCIAGVPALPNAVEPIGPPNGNKGWLLLDGTVKQSTGVGSIGSAMLLDKPPAHVVNYFDALRSAAFRRQVQSSTGVRLIGARGETLAQMPVEVGAHHHEGAQSRVSGFVGVIPWVDGVTRVEVVSDGLTVAGRAVSANAPVVSLDSPAAGAATRSIDVRWTAADADGDALTSSVQWSADGGRTWRPAALQTTGTSVRINAGDGMPGGNNVRIRVLVSDGLNTTVAESGRLSVPNAPPQVMIGAAETIRATRFDVLRLSAHASDPEDGALDSSVVWTSNRDGRLASGRALETRGLSAGTHVLTATATDSSGATATDSLVVTVVDDGRPAPRQAGSEPDAERQLRLQRGGSSPRP